MAKKKLLEDILQNPPRFYRLPADVLRDRRFDDTERLEILTAWQQAGGIHAADVRAVLTELHDRSANHAAQ